MMSSLLCELLVRDIKRLIFDGPNTPLFVEVNQERRRKEGNPLRSRANAVIWCPYLALCFPFDYFAHLVCTSTTEVSVCYRNAFPAFWFPFFVRLFVCSLACLFVCFVCVLTCVRLSVCLLGFACSLPCLRPCLLFVPAMFVFAGIVAIDGHVGRWLPREGALRQLWLRLLGSTAGEHCEKKNTTTKTRTTLFTENQSK